MMRERLGVLAACYGVIAVVAALLSACGLDVGSPAWCLLFVGLGLLILGVVLGWSPPPTEGGE